MKQSLLILASIIALATGAEASDATVPVATVTADFRAKPVPVSPILYGVFFEDINHGADGGIYAELIQNRSFEELPATAAWTAIKGTPTAKARIKTSREQPLNENNPVYGTLAVDTAGTGIANNGYGGIALKQGALYTGSVFLRSPDASIQAFHVYLDQGDGKPLAEAAITGVSKEWKRFEFSLSPSISSAKGRLCLIPASTGNFSVDMLSLFPKDTFRGRQNGLRKDLASLIADIQPGFMRFPGGCIVEGNSIENAYRWKDTIGPVEARKANENLWGYFQSYGLGFHEYFQYCEDIGAESVPIINCGMACQFRGGALVQMDDLDEWIQDALDLIEYATGPVTSAWGAKRAQNGHPAPFKLQYLGIGNEQWGELYYMRYQAFAAAIKARYPSIKLIFSAGPAPAGADFDNAWKTARSLKGDVVDEHYYSPPEWFLGNTHRYDNYSRSGPRVFVGEYAAHVGDRANSLWSALAEAAFMTGLERNGDVVEMASYAPLLAKDKDFQWNPDLAWFNSDQAWGTPNYWVQALFSRNKASFTIPTRTTIEKSPDAPTAISGGIGLGSWGTQVEYRDIKVMGGNGKTAFESGRAEDLAGWKQQGGEWAAQKGIFSQTSTATDCRLLLERPLGDGYTYSLKARKIAGSEGFLIIFGSRDGGYYWWNLGGWGNTTTCVQKGSGNSRSNVGQNASVTIDTGRWYDIRIELKGTTISCYLDGELIHQFTDEINFDPVYAHVGTAANGDIIVKIVNIQNRPTPVAIRLDGVGPLKAEAEATILSGPARDAVNTAGAPAAVAPRMESVSGVSGNFTYTAKASSVTILRIQRLAKGSL